MQGPPFRYLTNSYVEWLGLERFPVQRRDVVVQYISEHETIPVTYKAFDICVAYNHALYVREPDGLAWSVSR